MSEDQKSREEFDAWFQEESGGRQNMADYRHWAYAGWKARGRTYRASVLEEAAKICDRHAEGRCDSHESAAIINCADDIRALAAKTQEGQEP